MFVGKGFKTDIFMLRHRFSVIPSPVPGLLIVEKFLDQDALRELVSDFERFDKAAVAALEGAVSKEISAVMGGGGDSVTAGARLTGDNTKLKASLRFVPVRVIDSNGEVRNGEYFNEYYEKGHQLGYFRNNPNIPTYAWKYATRLAQFSATRTNSLEEVCR